MFRRTFRRLSAFAMAFAVVVPTHAHDRLSPIDPDPNSPTLGQLLDTMRPVVSSPAGSGQPRSRNVQPPVQRMPSPPPAHPAALRSETKPAKPATPMVAPAEKWQPELRRTAAEPSAKPRGNAPALITGSLAPAPEPLPTAARPQSFQPSTPTPSRSGGLQPPDYRPAPNPVALKPATPPAAPAAAQPISPAAPAQPAEAATTDAGFVFVIDQDLRSFLTDTAQRFGLRAEIASGIRGRLTRVRLPAEPRALLRELSTAHEIEWLLEGDVLKITSRSEIATRILPLGNVSFDDWSRELAAAGLDLTRYAPARMQGSNAAILTAPVALVARATAILEAMKNVKAPSQEIRLIRGGVSQKVQFD